MATTVEPLSSVLISLLRSWWLVLASSLLTISLSSCREGALDSLLKEPFRFSLHLIKKLLIRWVFMKADTKCPFSPCPSQTQKSFMPKGNFVSAKAISWLTFACLPVVPALVRHTYCTLWLLVSGSSLAFLVVLTSRVAEWVPTFCSESSIHLLRWRRLFSVSDWK